MPIQKISQKQLFTGIKRGRRSFDAQFLSRECDVFDVALGIARTLCEERGSRTAGDWQAMPQSYSNGPGGLSDVIRGLCLKQVIEGVSEKSRNGRRAARKSGVNRALNRTSNESFHTNALKRNLEKNSTNGALGRAREAETDP